MSAKKSRIGEFEDALSGLEKLVERLESGELSLEESLQQFERGIKLARQCQTSLKEAELKVAALLEEDGKQREEAFEGRG
jgi:exodeoxyribonuclease VII small subunit